MTGFIIFVVLMIIFGFGRNAARKQQKSGQPSARMQALMAKIQAQQSGNQPPAIQGQYTQPLPGQSVPTAGQPAGRAQASAQMAGMLQQLLQAGQGQRPPVQGQYSGPGQWQPAPAAAPVGPGQLDPQQMTTYYQQPHQQATVPAPNSPLERRVRELMLSGNEVPAIRLLCDEQDLGIIEAQKYARGLIAPAGKPGRAASAGDRPERDAEENRYVGSAAFAESVFDLDRDENVWASGWVEKPEPEDRSDMDELWQTVRNAGRPTNPPS